MKPLIQFKQARSAAAGLGLLILLMLACFGLLPQAQAQTNTAYGNGALVSLTSGVWNSGFGFEALNHDTAGSNNTATGLRSLFSDTSGSYNSANGVYALYGNTTGFFNTAAGAFALANNVSGNYNTANGYGALYRNTADNNTAIGFGALYKNTTGDQNTANGVDALFNNTTGPDNTAVGHQALFNNITGTDNTAIGFGALVFSNGGSNIAVGTQAGNAITTANQVIAIGASGANVSNSCYIGQIFGETSSGGTTVFINSDGKLGTTTSSRRFKEEIKPMEGASEALFALKPVTFRYKKGVDPQGIPQFGLVAEDVEAVNPDLVVCDKEGKVNTVRYEAVNAMLLNEFLKEHRKVEEQEATIAELKSTTAKQEAIAAQQQKEIRVLTASVKEQASQIRKVSDQLELNKPAPRTVLNDQ